MEHQWSINGASERFEHPVPPVASTGQAVVQRICCLRAAALPTMSRPCPDCWEILGAQRPRVETTSRSTRLQNHLIFSKGREFAWFALLMNYLDYFGSIFMYFS